MRVDSDLLSSIYTGRLQNLRQRAEDCGIPKTGSVEVLRAKLICEEILPDLDLTWEGIQSMSHKEIGEILKVFGIKSSGSHKERRQRLWLHLNYDSRRMTIENLAEMSRDDLHELCKRLELDLTGNRTVLMGRAAGVLTSQMNGWGRIKRSLRRNGIPSSSFESPPEETQPLPSEEIDESMFQTLPAEALLEDARDSMAMGIDKQPPSVQGDLLTIQARVEDLERMVGTILRGHGGSWGEVERDLLLRLADRRGWPIREKFVRHRVLMVATNIAEVKGAQMVSSGESNELVEDSQTTITRIRSKLSYLDNPSE
ncbi:MAG: hypothetical protein CMA88_02240 [Euryarchaeota archaeon]|nr:hypothetical protein [Euryarchaeota archaeon]